MQDEQNLYNKNRKTWFHSYFAVLCNLIVPSHYIIFFFIIVIVVLRKKKGLEITVNNKQGFHVLTEI